MPDRHEFHRFEICERIFAGTISVHGPYLKMLENRTFDHGVPLGSALTIAKAPGQRHYAVCKDHEPRIVLPLFAREEVEALAWEFGIPIADDRRAVSFMDSPAYRALKRWVKRHPGIAQACSHRDSYVPGWYDLGSTRPLLTPVK